MPDPATHEREIIQTVEALCTNWLQCSGVEEREELARQVGVCVSVFPWLWEALHPLIVDFLVTTLQLRPQPQRPGVRAPSPEPCCCDVTPRPQEPVAVRVGTVRLTTDTPLAHTSSASASSPPPACTEMPEAVDFGEEERQQVLRAYREDELRWKPWLITKEELPPAAPPRTGRPSSPPRSDYSSPASYLARMWSEDEEPVATEIQVTSASTSRRKRRSRRRRSSLRHVSPSTERHEEAVEVMTFDLEERQRAACAQLEEELRGKPGLAPHYGEIFRGTRLAFGGPRSCQELPPDAPPTLASSASAAPQEAPLSTLTGLSAKRRRRSRRHRIAQRPEVSECNLSSPASIEAVEDELDSESQSHGSKLTETHSVEMADSGTVNGVVCSSGFHEQGVRPTQTVNSNTGEFQPVFLSPPPEQVFDCPASKLTGESPVSCVSVCENKALFRN
ncbi:uncharacterized protein LOC121812898 [Haplochromis burtoni]|uniref:uncharacterized protein LOC121812898 n=1 Tax=Haplochromis burtoni TaxID=8153 RepID=UPI001C2D0434|nr:uncharacterized protein LOC121812898 [Haplochromis burtoni]